MSKKVNWQHARVKVGGDLVHVRTIIEICRRLGYTNYSDYFDWADLKEVDFSGFKEIFDRSDTDSIIRD